MIEGDAANDRRLYWMASVDKLLNSASGRTFVLIPLASIAFEVLQRRRLPQADLRYLPLMAAGYGLYRWAGAYRTGRGGGGPGMGRPPERLVSSGPYTRSRNPMYLGHLLFLGGLAFALRSPLAAALGAGQALTLVRHIRIDEQRLAQLFAAEYADYQARVGRWFSFGWSEKGIDQAGWLRRWARVLWPSASCTSASKS